MRKCGLTVTSPCLLALIVALPLSAEPIHMDPAVREGRLVLEHGQILHFRKEGAMLNNTGDYAWWYGCSPTSAGMMMGYYDRNGYGRVDYSHLVPGAEAEPETYAGPPTGWSTLANHTIASPGHVGDSYRAGYGAFGDDVAAPQHRFDCLADFMGTSQDSCGNSNSTTTFYSWPDGSRLCHTDVELLAPIYPEFNLPDTSGMYGIYEYLTYAGYGDQVISLCNQLIVEQGLQLGFSLADYRDEIDAGWPVMIHV